MATNRWGAASPWALATARHRLRRPLGYSDTVTCCGPMGCAQAGASRLGADLRIRSVSAAVGALRRGHSAHPCALLACGLVEVLRPSDVCFSECVAFMRSRDPSAGSWFSRRWCRCDPRRCVVVSSVGFPLFPRFSPSLRPLLLALSLLPCLSWFVSHSPSYLASLYLRPLGTSSLRSVIRLSLLSPLTQ